MGGFVIREIRGFARRYPIATTSIRHLSSAMRVCAGIVLRTLKKGAAVALTSLQRLRHNPLSRKYVHGERVLAQPMTSEWRPPGFVLQRKTHATIIANGSEAIRGPRRPRVALFVCLPNGLRNGFDV